MKNWIVKNYRAIIISAFLIPIITVAIVSISHVTIWYSISNPLMWAVYLSIGIEIAALSALAAISANMGSKVYFPFGIVTLIQFIGNIYFSYQFIDIKSETFTDWVELVAPLLEYIGIDPTDLVGHKRFLSLFAGGMLPIISLTFLHMLIRFTQENKVTPPVEGIDNEENKIDAKDLMGEMTRLRLSDNDLKILNDAIINPPAPNDKLKEAAEDYRKTLAKDIRESLKSNNNVESTKLFDDDEFNDLYNYDVYLKEKKSNKINPDDYINYINQEDIKSINNSVAMEESQAPETAKEMMLTTDKDIIESIPNDEEKSVMDLEETKPIAIEELPENQPTPDLPNPAIENLEEKKKN